MTHDDPIATTHAEIGFRRRYRFGFRWASDQPPLGWDGYLLWFLVHGQASWTIGNESHDITSGTCCLLPLTGPPLRLRCSPEGSQAVIWIHVTSRGSLDVPIFLPLERPDYAEALLEQCIDARRGDRHQADVCLQAFLYHASSGGATARGPAKDLSEFDILCRHMLAALHEEWPVERIAKQLGIAKRTVYDLFQREHGCTPHAFITSKRIEHAKHRLATTDEGLKQIAADLGFYDLYALSNTFLREVGVRPSHWRKQQQVGTAGL